ncbi:MAG TPA: UbiA family prenyltransferase [Candidatus Angelobacter sp.]|nr:UbiA family prenyltransferase [Candidatus Angelobacter sp.]
MPRLRTLFVLGRASNLPTVWSNCLAGWWLGGHENPRKLPFLFLGVTLLYIGGMYLNDAFDVNFDRQRRKERPIPTGAIALGTVVKLGLLWLALGVACLFWIKLPTGELGVVLAVCILFYDAIHKVITFSPLLMGACRFLVYLVASSIGFHGVTGWAIWCGLALGLYVIGLSFLARGESARGPVEYWPMIFLAAPIALAFCMNTGDYRRSASLLSLVLGLWVLRCLRSVFWSADRNVGRTVSGLLAGIVFVDWLAVPDMPRMMGIIFIVLFGLALLFQRFVPAT